MKIVILGSSGYIGSAFRALLESRSIPFLSPVCPHTPSEQKPWLQALARSRPDFIINCIGYRGKPNVDACESDKEACLHANATLPGLMRAIFSEHRIPWGHLSSGCLFTGHLEENGEITGFNEQSLPNFSFKQNNCSYYSGTKVLGEESLGYHEAQQGGKTFWAHAGVPDCYVWRVRIPFSRQSSSHNYLNKVMQYTTLLDVRNSLSCLEESVQACWDCWAQRVPYGLYNVTNPGSITTHEVAELIQKSPQGEKLKAAGKTFRFFKDEAEFRQQVLAPRSSCVLDSSKLTSMGIRLTPVDQAIESALADWQSERF